LAVTKRPDIHHRNSEHNQSEGIIFPVHGGENKQREIFMTAAIFTVRATISAEKEAAFNEWYNTDHAPQFTAASGATSARRFRKFLGDDQYDYMVVYEYDNRETLESFLASDQLAYFLEDYNRNFGAASVRVRNAYEQVWP